MIKELYVIKDTVTGEYGNPMPFLNVASAKRYFINNVCEENKKIAGDLQLFFVGEYNSELGTICVQPLSGVEVPCFIIGGSYE